MEANTATQVNAVIDHIADKLAVPSAKLMELLPALGVRDVIIGGGLLFCWIVLVIALVLCVRAALRKHDSDALFIASLFLGGPALVSLPLVIFNLSDLVLWLYNPEAWAVRYVFNRFFSGE